MHLAIDLYVHRFWLGVDVFDDHELCLVDCIFVVLTCVHKCNGMACMHAACMHACSMQQAACSKGIKGGFSRVWRSSWFPYRNNLASREAGKQGSQEAGKQGSKGSGREAREAGKQ